MTVGTEKIECKICGAMEHVLEAHLAAVHEMTVDDYLEKYPDAEVLSELAKAKLAEMEASADNKRIEYNVKKTFGIRISDEIDAVWGWEKPHELTPEIDDGYVFNKRQLALVLMTLEDPDERLLLTGPTGAGKTTCIEQVFARLNRPLIRINGDGDLTRMDLIGEKDIRDNETFFTYGLIPRAVKEDIPVLLDEHDALDPSTKLVLQGLMEPKGKLVLTETSETLSPGENFRIFATGNTLGQGDETGLYAGTQPQNYANTMRFTLFDIVDYPSKVVEKKIITKKSGITDRDALDKLLQYAEEMREAYKKQEIQAVMSTRSLVNVAKKMIKLGNVRFAYEVGFINAQNSDDQEFCSNLLQRIWGL